MATIDPYRKYLKQAQIDYLVKKQADYNNAHADERVGAMQSVRDQLDQGRRMLQNRGLASRPGNIISGEEPRLTAAYSPQFDQYNKALRGVEENQLEYAAITEANKTIAERNAAAAARAREEAQRQAAQQAKAAAQQAAMHALGSNILGGVAAAAASQKPQPVKPTLNPSWTAAGQQQAEQKANSTAQNKAVFTAVTETSRANGAAASGRKLYTPQQIDRFRQIGVENGGDPSIAYGDTDIERQKAAFLGQSGYNTLERQATDAEKRIQEAQTQLNALKQQQAQFARAGQTMFDERTRTGRQVLTPQVQAQKDAIDTKIKDLQRYIGQWQHERENIADQMQSINNEWSSYRAFAKYGNMSDEELEKALKPQQASIPSAPMTDALGAWSASRAASGETQNAGFLSDEDRRDIEAVQKYRQQQKRDSVIARAETYAKNHAQNGEKATADKSFAATTGRTVPRENMLNRMQAMGQYNAKSVAETGSKYYKAINDRDELSEFIRLSESNGQDALSNLKKGFLPDKEERDTIHFVDYATQMTPEEIDTFNMLYNGMGAKAADEYFEALLPTLDQRGANSISEEARQAAQKYGLLTDILSVPVNLLSGIHGPISNLSDRIYGYDVGKYKAARNDISGIYREQRQAGMNGTDSFAYSTAMSMADSTVSALLTKAFGGPLGEFALGGSAYNSAYREALERGMNQRDASVNAIASGVLEALFEHISLDKLIKTGPAGSGKEVVKNILIQAGIEGSEEVNTNLANRIFDLLYNGTDANIMQTYQRMIDRGYSPARASMEAMKEAGSEDLMAFLGGAVAGGLSSAGWQAVQTGTFKIQQYISENHSEAGILGKNLKANGWDELVKNYTFQDEDAEALRKRGNWSNAELGTLYGVMRAEQQLGAIGKTVRESGGVEALRTFKFDNSELQELAEQEELSDVELSQLYTGMQQQLYDDARQRLGVEGKDTLPIFEKIFYGEDISHAEGVRIAENETAMQTFNAIFTTNATNGIEVRGNANRVAKEYRSSFGTPVNAETISQVQRERRRAQDPTAYRNTDDGTLPETVREHMTPEQRRAAALPSESDHNGTLDTERGSVTYSFKEANNRFLTQQQEAAKKFAQAIANTTGANVRLVDTMEANGMYDRSTNTLTVALDSTRGVVSTASHELTHWLENNSPEAYAEFVDVLEKEINRIGTEGLKDLPEELQTWVQEHNNGEPLFDTLVAYEQSKDNSLTKEQAKAEAVAECCEPFLKNKAVQERMAKETTPTARKVRKYFSDMAKSVRSLITGNRNESKEARILERGANDLQAIADAWAAAITKASKQSDQRAGTKEGVQKQARLQEGIISDSQIAANRTAVVNDEPVIKLSGNEFQKSEIGLIQQVVDYFNSIGNKVRNNILGDVELNRRGVKTDLAHGMGSTKASAFKAIPDVIEKGKIIDIQYGWKNRNYDTAVIAAPITISETKYLMGVVVAKREGSDNLYVHEVIAMNEKDRPLLVFKTGGLQSQNQPDSGLSPLMNLLKNVVDVKPQLQKRDSETQKKLDRIAEGIFPKQEELARTRKEVKEIEEGEEYNRVVDAFMGARGDDFDVALKQYTDFLKQSGLQEKKARIDAIEKEITEANKTIQKLLSDEAYQKYQSDLDNSGLDEAEFLRKRAVKEFGYTTSYAEAGYMLPNGKMLNFSGEKGAHRGSRGQDHRAIGTIFPDVQGSEAMRRFMRDGNIRIMAETPGLDVVSSVEPTREQYAAIRSYASSMASKRFFNVDITDENGDNIGSLQYDGRVNPDRIVNDIKHYYATGEIREQSAADRFRYQRRDAEDILAPIFDEDADEDTRPEIDTADVDTLLSRQRIGRAGEKLVEKRAAQNREWAKRTATAGGKHFAQKEVNRIAKALLKAAAESEQGSVLESTQSSVKLKAVSERLAVLTPRVWDGLMSGDAEQQQKALDDFRRLAREIVTGTEGKDMSRATDLQILREQIPHVIYLNEAQAAEVKNARTNLYNYTKELRKALGDNSIIVRAATDAAPANLDGAWQAITGTVAQEYTDISDADQPLVLLDVAQSLATTTEKAYKTETEIGDAIDRLAGEMIGMTAELTPTEDTASKTQAHTEVTQAIAERGAYFKRAAEQLAARLKEIESEYAAARKENRADVREYEAQIKELNRQIAENKRYSESLEKKVERLKEQGTRTAERADRRVLKVKEHAAANRETQRQRAQERIEAAREKGKENVRTEREKGRERLLAEREKSEQRTKEAVETARESERAAADKRQERALAEQREKAKKFIDRYGRKLKNEGIELAEKANREGVREGKKAKAEETERKRLKKSIEKGIDKLTRAALHPTTRDHIPESLMQQTKTYLMALSNWMLNPKKTMDAKVLLRLQDAYTRLKYDGDGVFAVVQDPEMTENLSTLVSITNQKAFKDLTSEDLRLVNKTMTGITHAITSANQLIGRNTKLGIYESADKLIKELRDAPEVKGKKYLFRFLSAERFARLATGYKQDAELVKEMQYLNEGAINKERYAMEGNKIFTEFMQQYGKEYEKFSGKKAEWYDTGWKALDDTPVMITPAMKLSLIMHSRNAQNMYHALKGGFVMPDMKLYKKGKIHEAYTNGHRVVIGGADIAALEASMTEAERAYLKCAEEVFYRYCPQLINKASLDLYGYRKAEVQNYFPIRTDTHFNQTNFESIVQNASLENMGMLKERVKKSAIPIVLEDINQAVARQIQNTALFAGMAVPIRNFNRVYNQSMQFFEDSVKLAIDQKLGESGTHVLEGIMRDLQKKPQVDPYGKILGKLQSGYVRATLAMNLSVTMKQAASYPTAAAVVGWKPLIKALAKGGRNGHMFSRADMDLIDRYTPLLYNRQNGMFDRDVADYAKQEWTQKKPAKYLMNWIQSVDVATVGRLWYAAEYYVQDHNTDLNKGSDAYYKEVAKVFNRIVQETQPNYSVMQRPDVLRTENAIMRSITMFKTQSFQNGGILVDAIGEFRATRSLEKTDEARQAANRKLALAVSSQIVQNIVLTGMKFIADALYQRMNPWRDEDKEITGEGIGSYFTLSMLSSMAGSFWLGSEIFDALMTALNGITGNEVYAVYDKSSPAVDVLNDLMTGFNKLSKTVNKLTDGEAHSLDEYTSDMDKVATAVSEVFGIPYKNVKKLIGGGVNWYKDIATATKTGEMDWFRYSSDEMDSAKTAAAYKGWTDAGNSGKTFFYYKHKFAPKGMEEKEKVAELMNDSELTPQQKAELDRLLVHNSGDTERRVTGGRIEKMNNKDEWEIITDYTNETMYEASKLSAKRYEKVVSLSQNGFTQQQALTVVKKYKEEFDAGEGYNDRFREALFADKTLTPEQKATADAALIGNKTVPDYHSEPLFYISQQSEARQKAAKQLIEAGVTEDMTAEILRVYAAEGKAGKGQKERFREWLKKQSKLTKAQKELIDMTVTGVKKPALEY